MDGKTQIREKKRRKKKKKEEEREKVNEKKEKEKTHVKLLQKVEANRFQFTSSKLPPPSNPVWNQIWQRARKPKGENGGKKNKINGIKVELNAGKGFEIGGGETR